MTALVEEDRVALRQTQQHGDIMRIHKVIDVNHAAHARSLFLISDGSVGADA